MKTSELTDIALDWAVAEARRRGPKKDMYAFGGIWRGWWLTEGGEYERMPAYSTDWAQGGPIIEREELTLSHSPYDHIFYGRSRPWCAKKKGLREHGPTPLIAAMRCYVASKMGDTIDIPTELGDTN